MSCVTPLYTQCYKELEEVIPLPKTSSCRSRSNWSPNSNNNTISSLVTVAAVKMAIVVVVVKIAITIY